MLTIFSLFYLIRVTACNVNINYCHIDFYSDLWAIFIWIHSKLVKLDSHFILKAPPLGFLYSGSGFDASGTTWSNSTLTSSRVKLTRLRSCGVSPPLGRPERRTRRNERPVGVLGGAERCGAAERSDPPGGGAAPSGTLPNLRAGSGIHLPALQLHAWTQAAGGLSPAGGVGRPDPVLHHDGHPHRNVPGGDV